MSNQINCQNQQPPAYSGITINITNPTLNPPAQNNYYSTTPEYLYAPQYAAEKNQLAQANLGLIPENNVPYINKGSYLEPISDNNSLNNRTTNNTVKTITSSDATGGNNQNIYNDSKTVNQYTTQIPENNTNSAQAQSYPSEYYLNNYGNIPQSENNKDGSDLIQEDSQQEVQMANSNGTSNPNGKIQITEDTAENQNNIPSAEKPDAAGNTAEETANNNSANEIIANLDERAAAQRELEQNGKKTKVVSLTNEYIMSLENYLNNPNKEIRLTASKEIIKRLNEDAARYDDAALNALLNKMLQDPEKLIRIAALSALSSELASGNDYTIQLLKQIQQNPNADPEDVLDASEILLKRAAMTEIRYVQQTNNQTAEPQKYIMKAGKESSEA